MSAASRRRPPPRRGQHYDDYAGPDPYRDQPPYGGPGPYGGQEAYQEGGYGYQYGYEPGTDDWWEEGTGGMFSPVRVLLGLLVIGAGAAAFYGLFVDRTTLQMPITVSGLAVLGLALVLLALSSASGAASLGRRGHGGKALVAALFGGFCALGGFGSLAGAIVLGMLAASA